MYTPHTVTLFNTWEDDSGTMHYSATILKGVMCQISQADNVSKSGLSSADAVNLFIPMNVNATSILGAERTFAKYHDFIQAADKSTLWTLNSGGQSNSAECFFVKGIITEENSYAYIRNKYDDVYTVTKVDIRDFGTQRMRHWQVSGK